MNPWTKYCPTSGVVLLINIIHDSTSYDWTCEIHQFEVQRWDTNQNALENDHQQTNQTDKNMVDMLVIMTSAVGTVPMPPAIGHALHLSCGAPSATSIPVSNLNEIQQNLTKLSPCN